MPDVRASVRGLRDRLGPELARVVVDLDVLEVPADAGVQVARRAFDAAGWERPPPRVLRAACDYRTTSRPPSPAAARLTRRAAWRTLRAEVLERDEHRCRWWFPTGECARPANTVVLVTPPRQGGRLAAGNCRSVCERHRRIWQGLQAWRGGRRKPGPINGRAAALAWLLDLLEVDPYAGRRTAAAAISAAIGKPWPADAALTEACARRRNAVAVCPFPALDSEPVRVAR